MISRTTPAVRAGGWAELSPDQQMGAVRPSLRGHQRRGAADRAGAGGAVWIYAGDAVDRDRRLPRRGGAGFSGAGGEHPAGRQIAGADRRAGHRSGRRGRRRRSRSCSSSSSRWRGWEKWWSRRWAARTCSIPPAAGWCSRRRATARAANADGTYTIPAGHDAGMAGKGGSMSFTSRFTLQQRRDRMQFVGNGVRRLPDRTRCSVVPGSSLGHVHHRLHDSRSRCSSACTCTGSARAGSSRHRSSAAC